MTRLAIILVAIWVAAHCALIPHVRGNLGGRALRAQPSVEGMRIDEGQCTQRRI
jgi:hypothetical protein